MSGATNSPAEPERRAWEPPIPLDWEWLPRASSEARDCLLRAGAAANREYTEGFVEKHLLCPFARTGRRRGETRSEVVWLDRADEGVLVEPLLRAIEEPSLVVLQLVLAGFSIDAESFLDVAARVTRRAHFLSGGEPVFAIAGLHPKLPFRVESPYGLIPLFRRAPDPTFQWVRLSALREIHRGREKGSTFVDPAHVVALLTHAKVEPSLYDRVAMANEETARRVGITAMEAELATLHEKTQRRYREILTGDAPPRGSR